jgi:hypothetical protein
MIVSISAKLALPTAEIGSLWPRAGRRRRCQSLERNWREALSIDCGFHAGRRLGSRKQASKLASSTHTLANGSRRVARDHTHRIY